MPTLDVLVFWIAEFGILTFLIWACIYISTLSFSALKHAPFVPTRVSTKPVIARARPRKGQTFIDLGSGDGRVVITAAKEFGLNAIGYEINPVLIFLSKLRARIAKTDVQFIRADLYDAGLCQRPALYRIHHQLPPIIYIFLLPRYMDHLGKKIIRSCPPGTVVISYGFVIPLLSDKLYTILKGKPFPTYYYKL